MPAMENVKCLVDVFNERFSRYDMALTAEDVERGSGVIDNGDDGWPLDVPYRFGTDAAGEYLDYYFWYSYHQMVPDHIRIRCDLRDEMLPVQDPCYSYPPDATEEEKTRREQEHYASNRRIGGMLCAKGFESSRIKENVPVQVVYVSRRDESGAWITKEELTFEWRGNYDEALGAAMWLVDDAMASLYRHGMNSEELMALYRASGPDPYIRYEDRLLAQAANPPSAWFFIYQPIPFNAWGYAETVCHRLCSTPIMEPSVSLTGWQGRYDRYDRHRMESQLFLDRSVRLTCDLPVGDTVIPIGRNGEIGTYEYDYVSGVPVIFALEPLSLWRRIFNFYFDVQDRRTPLALAVPYDALEFVESDAVYSAYLDEVFAEIR